MPGETKPKSKRGGKRPGTGGKIGARLSQVTRERIRGTLLLKRMEDIALGKVKGTPHQVAAGLGVLKFALPSLTAVDVTSKGKEIIGRPLVFTGSDPLEDVPQ